MARGRDRGEGRGVYIKRFGISGIRSGCKLRFQFSSVFMCGDEQNTVMVRNHYMANVFLETKQHKCKMAAARWWATCSARHQTGNNTFNACCESYLVTSKI